MIEVKLTHLTCSDDIAIKFRYLFFQTIIAVKEIWMGLTKDDIKDLRYAKTLLENPSLAARISNLLGSPIEKGFEALPETWKDVVQRAAEKSLAKALNFALRTMSDKTRRASSDKTHKMFVLATGAGSGASNRIPI